MGTSRVPVSGQWDVRAAVVSGEWCQYLVVLQVAAKVYAAAQAQQERSFVEVTTVQPTAVGGVAVTVRIGRAEMDIHNGANASTIEAVLRAVKSC